MIDVAVDDDRWHHVMVSVGSLTRHFSFWIDGKDVTPEVKVFSRQVFLLTLAARSGRDVSQYRHHQCGCRDDPRPYHAIPRHLDEC